MDCFLYIYYSRLRHRYKSNFNRKKIFYLISSSIMAPIKSEPTDFFIVDPATQYYTMFYTYNNIRLRKCFRARLFEIARILIYPHFIRLTLCTRKWSIKK